MREREGEREREVGIVEVCPEKSQRDRHITLYRNPWANIHGAGQLRQRHAPPHLLCELVKLARYWRQGFTLRARDAQELAG
jgi:hypothetical protein